MINVSFKTIGLQEFLTRMARAESGTDADLLQLKLSLAAYTEVRLVHCLDNIPSIVQQMLSAEVRTAMFMPSTPFLFKDVLWNF